MLHNFPHLRRCITILTLAVLSFGARGKVNLCLMPDGDMHLEHSHLACGLTGEGSDTTDESALSGEQVENQGQCVDLSLGGVALDHHPRNVVQLPLPVMVPLGPPIILALIEPKPCRTTPAVTPPPQLASLQSVVLLI